MDLNFPTNILNVFGVKSFFMPETFSIETENDVNKNIKFYYRDSKGNRIELFLKQGFFVKSNNVDPLLNEMIFQSVNINPIIKEGYNIYSVLGICDFALCFNQNNWYIPITFNANKKELYLVDAWQTDNVKIVDQYNEFKTEYLEEEVKPEPAPAPEEVKTEEVKTEEKE